MRAIDYEPPHEPAVLYFYNPFDADVMKQVLAKIEQSWRACPRHLVLVYHNPKQRQVFDDAKFLQLTYETENVFPWLVFETSSVPAHKSSTGEEHRVVDSRDG